MAKVSIIVPVFNKQDFLLETISSVEEQSYKNWELILVDDHSTDNSFEIAREKADQSDKIVLLKNAEGRKGGSICRNIGIEKCNGEYILFLDADDIIQSNCLADRIASLESKEGLDFAVFPMGIFFDKIGDRDFKWDNFEGDLLKRFLAHDLPWTALSVLWRTQTVKDLNGFQEEFIRLQDVELHTRALLDPSIKYSCFSNDKPDCYYRTDQNRIETKFADYKKRRIFGTHQYISYFKEQLESQGKHKMVKYLKITYFETLRETLVEYNRGKLTTDEIHYLMDLLHDKIMETGILSKPYQKLVKWYMSVQYSNKGFRGLNHLMRKIFLIS